MTLKRKTFLNLCASLCILLSVFFLCQVRNSIAADTAEADAEAAEKEAKDEKARLDKATQTALVAAQDLMKVNDYVGARKPLLDLLATNPVNLPETFYLMLGQCWYGDETAKSKGEEAQKALVKEAQKVFKAGYALYPASEGLLMNYAIATYELEEFADAGSLFEKIYNTQAKKDIKYLTYSAAAYYAGEKLNDAKRIFLQMIDIAPKPETTWYESVISICLEQNDSACAEKYTFVALDLFPMEKKYWDLMARIRLEKEDYKGAAGALEIGTRVKAPEKSEELTTLIDLYNAVNVPLRSVKGLQKKLELSKKAITEDQHIAIAELYAKAFRTDEAVKYIDSVIAKAPSSKLLMEKAKLLYNDRMNEEAIKVFDEVIKADTKAAGEAYFMKGLAAWDMKDWDTAERAFNGALNSKEYKAQAQNGLDIIASLYDAKNK